jgi:phage virion morphogenesis protein
MNAHAAHTEGVKMSEVVKFKLDAHEVEAELGRLQKRLNDIHPVMKAISVELLSVSMQSFEKQRTAGGEKWKPLALSTIRGREKRGSWPGQILDDGTQEKTTRHLSRTLVASHSPTHAQVGVTPNPYAAIHQFGGMAGRGRKVKIEARPFLPMRRSSEGSGYELEPKVQKSILSLMRVHFST